MKAPTPLARIAEVYHGKLVLVERGAVVAFRIGDVLACSWADSRRYPGDPPLRNGRLVVSEVRRKTGELVTTRDPYAAVPAICYGECGDWLYRLEPA